MMKKNDNGNGLSRREFLAGSLALAAGSLMGEQAHGQGAASRPQEAGKGTRVILLGNGGGPRTNKLHNQSSWLVMVDDTPYVVDCGAGVSRQLVFAGVLLRNLKHIFITHNHSDHNLEYGGSSTMPGSADSKGG